MTDHIVAQEGELLEGEHVTTQIEGKEISVFNIDGEYYAYVNWCIHQGGPICEGAIGATTAATYDKETLETKTRIEREGEVLYCPWHGWQYDVTSGKCLSRNDVTLPSFPVTVENGKIVVSV